MNFAKMLKSKTVWGGIILGAQQVLNAVLPLAMAGVMGEKVQGIITGLGIILGAVGVKHAISKTK